ncbi:alpha-1,2-mannosyltransferase Mnn2p [[Candida] jaroonii]|uniref:Alpha-1,2-mannosyltransferase Mnn2p n=1 Tax=[Candida] jaroonii TaxID=467808 RepID=A0ACA9Y5R3_9ASCO|nr:alpha-1,2-mannosyltransferase Mnn2p [[Candida] jaroonii]
MLRRRSRILLVSIILSGCILILYNVLKYNEFEVEIESSVINSSSFFKFYNKKTTPFSETNAAKQTEMNLNINNFDNLPLDKQLSLISQYTESYSADKLEFFEKIFDNFYENKPSVVDLSTYHSDERIYHARYNSKDDDSEDNRIVFNEAYLSSFLQLDDDELKAMKKSHSNIIKNIPKSAPKNFYRKNGIVFVGGGKFNFLTLLSIKHIRDLGSKTPIEVLIPTLDEFESNLCFKVFPQYNAKCLVMPHILNQYSEGDNVFKKFEFKGYQYKVLALLLSSFEKILFLDSDNTPTQNPDSLFESEPFSSHGLIVWPDFWKRATSPTYYDIAGINIDKTKFLPRYNELINDYENIDYSKFKPQDIPFHQYKGAIPDPTNESGQLMINKKTHLNVLILALYYNLFGPSHYYPLFSQGSDGEGDKETFLASCVALNCKFYQVKKFLKAMGYFNSNLNFVGTGMGQYNPVHDYRNEKLPEDQKHDDLLFIHSNFPKLNPWDLKVKGKLMDNGERLRLYGNAIKLSIGYDFEKVQWQNMKYFLCDLKVKVAIFNDVEKDDLCKEIEDQLSFLTSTTHLTKDAF